jgi:hypothetical protein
MAESIEQDLRYPIGRLKFEALITPDMIISFIRDIEEAPVKLHNAVKVFRKHNWILRTAPGVGQSDR